MSARRNLPSLATLRRDGTPFTTADISNLIGRDETAWLSGFVTPALIVVREIGALSGDELRSITLEDAVGQIAESARRIGAYKVLGDQRDSGGMTALLRQHGLSFDEVTWTSGSKASGFQLLRRLLRERRVALPTDPKLKAELLAAKARLAPSGAIVYPHAGDRASCLVTLCIAIGEGMIRMDGPLGMDALQPHDGDDLRAQWHREQFPTLPNPYEGDFGGTGLTYERRGSWRDGLDY